MAMAILFTVVVVGAAGAGTALALGSGWGMALLAYFVIGNLACIGLVGLAALRDTGHGPDRRHPQRVNAGTRGLRTAG